MDGINTPQPKTTVTETDIRNLEKAKLYEEDKKKQGWQWKKVSNTLTLLVPCDEEGNPTNEGLKIIKRQKARFGIYKIS